MIASDHLGHMTKPWQVGTPLRTCSAKNPFGERIGTDWRDRAAGARYIIRTRLDRGQQCHGGTRIADPRLLLQGHRWVARPSYFASYVRHARLVDRRRCIGATTSK